MKFVGRAFLINPSIFPNKKTERQEENILLFLCLNCVCMCMCSGGWSCGWELLQLLLTHEEKVKISSRTATYTLRSMGYWTNPGSTCLQISCCVRKLNLYFWRQFWLNILLLAAKSILTNTIGDSDAEPALSSSAEQQWWGPWCPLSSWHVQNLHRGWTIRALSLCWYFSKTSRKQHF